MAEGNRSWSKVKRYVEEAEGRVVSKGILHNVLMGLERLSILRDYRFPDPVYELAAKRMQDQLRTGVPITRPTLQLTSAP